MECWQVALQSKTTPSAMALSRQKTPAVRTTASSENLSAKGAYEIKAASGDAKVTLFGTGTELALALKAAETLEAEGVPTRVVSVPSFELFEQQDAKYQASVLGRGTVRVAVEAAIKQGWERFIGEDGGFVGMTGFGASAPAEVLYDKFGITADAVVAAAKAKL
jgi:transketolase